MYLPSYPSCVDICLPCWFYLSYVGASGGCGIFKNIAIALESLKLTLLIVVLLDHLFCWVTFQTITPSLKEDLLLNVIAGKHWVNTGKTNGDIVPWSGIGVEYILVMYSNEIGWHPNVLDRVSRSVEYLGAYVPNTSSWWLYATKGFDGEASQIFDNNDLMLLQMREPRNLLMLGNTCFRLCSSASMLSPYC